VHRIFNRSIAFVLACLLIGTLAGFVTGQRVGNEEGSDRSHPLPNTSIACRPGPWGDLTYTPFSIAAPDDLIPVRGLEANGTHWFFKGYTADSFVTLLQSTSLSPDQQHALLSPPVFNARPDGVELTPTPDQLFGLPPDARARMYQVLAQSPENDQEMNFIPKDAVDAWFAVCGVSKDTSALFRKLCCERGDYLMFSGLSAILSRLSTYEEKLHFAKALTEQRTMLLRLRLNPQSDVDALAKYWGRGCARTDPRAILKSLAAIPNGTAISILMLMPDLPAGEIYDYPHADNPMDGPPVNRDCAWTTLNFFKDEPEPAFGTLEGVARELKANYLPVPDAPRYGDAVLFARPDGFVVHMAVYIADDICFTKNGSTMMHPWMLSKLDDVSRQFAFQIGPQEKLTIRYFRKKEFF